MKLIYKGSQFLEVREILIMFGDQGRACRIWRLRNTASRDAIAFAGEETLQCLDKGERLVVVR